MRDSWRCANGVGYITARRPIFSCSVRHSYTLTEPALARLGLRCVAWNVRSLDSVDSRSERVAARVGRRLAPGAIVLMHDGMEGRRRIRPVGRAAPSMLGALPLVLAMMRDRAWRSVTLPTALPA